jgi:hypothetical protein
MFRNAQAICSKKKCLVKKTPLGTF